MEASTREVSQTPKHYDHSGAKKKSVVWKYFALIKAKDGTATPTLIRQRLYVNYAVNHIFS